MSEIGPSFVAVREFLASGNRYDVDSQMLLLAPDAIIQVPGVGSITGHQNLREFLEFEVGLRRQVTMIDCRFNRDHVICDCVRRDDWLTAVGITEFHTSYEVAFRDGLIGSIVNVFSSYSADLMGKTLEEFIPWTMRRYPELFREDGSFRLGREAGRGLATAAREWVEL